jgi:uncharacterized protein YecE (DUF72 family)
MADRLRGNLRSVQIRIGCSGWNYRHWKTPVYRDAPARRWLEI